MSERELEKIRTFFAESAFHVITCPTCRGVQFYQVLDYARRLLDEIAYLRMKASVD